MNFYNLKTNKANKIEGVLLIKPEIYADNRGYFYESWNEISFNNKNGATAFCQDNHSKSSKGVLRGIHYQIAPYSQGKLVRCTRGTIFDVAVDLRKCSKTYKEWISVELNAVNKYLFWIPEGFGHGFISLEEDTEVQYKVTKKWDKKYEKTIFWNDPDLNIDWPVSQLSENIPITSIKDNKGMSLKEAEALNFIF